MKNPPTDKDFDKSRLNVQARRAYRGNTAVLTAWKTASHIKRAPRSDKDDDKDKQPEEK